MKVLTKDLQEALRLLKLGVDVKELTTPKGRQWYDFQVDTRTIFIAKNMPTAWAFVRGLAHGRSLCEKATDLG